VFGRAEKEVTEGWQVATDGARACTYYPSSPMRDAAALANARQSAAGVSVDSLLQRVGAHRIGDDG